MNQSSNNDISAVRGKVFFNWTSSAVINTFEAATSCAVLAAISWEQTISSSYLPVCSTTLSADSLWGSSKSHNSTHSAGSGTVYYSCYGWFNKMLWGLIQVNNKKTEQGEYRHPLWGITSPNDETSSSSGIWNSPICCDGTCTMMKKCTFLSVDSCVWY